MFTPSDIQDLHDTSSEELREQVSHIAGVLAHRHGSPEAAVIFGRIAASLSVHIQPQERPRASRDH